MVRRKPNNSRANFLFIIILWMMLFVYFVPFGISDTEDKQVMGSIRGTVKNFTTDKIAPQQKVTLYVYQNDAEAGNQSVVSDSDGVFEFSELQMEPSLSYKLTTHFQDADYSSPLIRLTSKHPEQTVDLKAYSSSDDDSKIQITAHHLIIESIENALQVTEYIILQNAGNTSYLISSSEGNKIGLRLELPNGFKDLKIEGLMECCISFDENTLLYSHATLPGMMHIIFSYHMPSKKHVNLSRRLSFNTSKLLALVGGEHSSLTSNTLSDSGQAQMKGKTYTKYTANNLNKKQAIDIQLELPVKWRFNPVWLFGMVLVVGLAAILVVRRLSTSGLGGDVSVDDSKLVQSETGRRMEARVEADSSSVSSAETESADLKRGYLELISRLDEMYEAGEIPETVYKKMREEQKAKLREVMNK